MNSLIVFLGMLGMAVPTSGGYVSSQQPEKDIREHQQRTHVGNLPVHGMQLESSPRASGVKVDKLRGGA